MDMADCPEGADLSQEQAVIVVCSTQVSCSRLERCHYSLYFGITYLTLPVLSTHFVCVV